MMKAITLGCLMVLMAMGFGTSDLYGQVFWQDNFEGTAPNMGGGTRSPIEGDGPDVCGSSDYFYRTDCNLASGSGRDCSGVSDVFAGVQGSFMWRGEDLDGCTSDPDIVEFLGIDISGRGALEFRGLFACDDDPNEWEGPTAADGHPDYIRIDYQIDGGGWQPGLDFRSDGSANATFGDGRGVFQVDTDGDGVGDGGIVMDKTFKQFTFDISGSGTTLDLRLVAFVNGSGEEFGVDLFEVNVTGPLPVEMTDFNGQLDKGMVYLNWETVTEINNMGFEVQRSINGKDWKTLDFVDGAGQSQTLQQYQYIDDSPNTGISYYRLNQIDLNGAASLSQVITIRSKKPMGKFSELYPNPSYNGLVNIDIDTPAKEVLTLEVYDLMGRLLHSQQLSVAKGEQTIELNLGHLGNGIFNLMWQDTETQTYQQLVIH
ncbi:MAG: T9SS type A sorting domain-containing protein [Bacteroidota bacterium]